MGTCQREFQALSYRQKKLLTQCEILVLTSKRARKLIFHDNMTTMGRALCMKKHGTQTSLSITGSLKQSGMSDFSNAIPDDNYFCISYLILQKLLKNTVTPPYSYICSLWQTKGTTTNKQTLGQSPAREKA